MSPENLQKRSELSDFVLGYCRYVGAIVDPPAYEVHDVLLPEKVASQLGVASYQRFIFSERVAQEPSGEITFLHYGHPFVERIVEAVREQTASAQLFINAVRLSKRGLFSLARETLAFANARLFKAPNAVEARTIYHYARFNFKASLITDEKRELVLPVWMHMQGGYTVDGEAIERLASFDTEPTVKNLHKAAPIWLLASDKTSGISEIPDIFDRAVMSSLLERARKAALEQLTAGPLKALQRRANRFLELDRARLDQYYTDMKRDLEKRLRRAGDERQTSLETKLATVTKERQAKLADVEEKYRLRVELELLNLLIIAQPKITLPVVVKNRSTTVIRQIVWDPLLHRLEPLACDVCGRAAYNLWLCEGKHLAHADCLTPQCVDCKRVYCRLCVEQIKACVVCNRPVCVSSLNRCSICGRDTCRNHIEMCHADDGKPVSIGAMGLTPEPVNAQTAESSPLIPEKITEKSSPKPPPKSRARRPAKKNKPSPKKTGAKRPRTVKKPKLQKAQRVEVFSEMSSPLVSAYVIKGKREIAARYWELTDEGIRVSCRCKKLFCRENGMLLRPKTANRIESQILGEIHSLREEYHVPTKGVQIYRVIRDQPQHERRLMLFGQWKDADFLARAQMAFDEVE